MSDFVLSRPSRRTFVLALTLPAAARLLSAQKSANEDVILKAMRDELERSRQLKVGSGTPDEVPYFIAYTLNDDDSFSVSATMGAVTNSGRNASRVPSVEVRVGNFDFDNTGHIFSGLYSGSRFDSDAWPLDDNYQNLRESLWLATDHAFRAAVESIGRKRAALTNAAAQPERLPDYSKSDAVTDVRPIYRPKIDEAAWTARVTKLSALFNAYPNVLGSGVELALSLGNTYYVNSEGSSLRYPDSVAWLIARAEGQSPDGMIIRDGLSVQALEDNEMPSDADLERSVKDLAERVTARVKAPLGDQQYTGPVLFEPLAAAQLFAQLLGDNLRSLRKPVSDPGRPVNFVASEFETRLNARVLPDWLEAVDDPTQTAWQGKKLVGHYEYDLEGVKAKSVKVIEKGILRSYLSTRLPVKGSPASNGHARLPGGNGTKGAGISNLLVRASRSESFADLKAKLIQMCKDRDKPYGMLVRRLDFPFSSTGADLQNLLAASRQSGGSVRAMSPPVLIYRVYTDGREELIRGMRFTGVSSRTLREIEAASTETAMFDYVANGAPLALLGSGGVLSPTSVVAPGLLFEELELERAQEQLQKPPIVPPPNTGA
jgi:TldD protein